MLCVWMGGVCVSSGINVAHFTHQWFKCLDGFVYKQRGQQLMILFNIFLISIVKKKSVKGKVN